MAFPITSGFMLCRKCSFFFCVPPLRLQNRLAILLLALLFTDVLLSFLLTVHLTLVLFSSDFDWSAEPLVLITSAVVAFQPTSVLML